MSFHFDHWEIEENYPVVFSHRRRSLTKTPPLFDPNSSSSKKNKVRFSEKCSVILIPSRQEYLQAGIQLWSNPMDQEEAKKETMEEIRHAMDYNPMLSMPMALTYLYQPKYEPNYAHHSDLFRDAKERLNILLIDSDHETALTIKNSLKQVLQSFNQFVLSIIHEEDSEQGINRLQRSFTCAAVSSIDVILIQESIFLDVDCVEEDEDALLDLLNAIHHMYKEKAPLSPPPLASGSTSPLSSPSSSSSTAGMKHDVLVGMIISDNKCSNRLKELGKRGSVDFVWKMPINSYIPMLPLILNERRSLGTSLPVFASTLQHSSISSSSSSLNLLKKKLSQDMNHEN